MYSLDDLDVYNLAQSFSDKVWFQVIQWDSFAKFGLGTQLTDADDSISANISEGYGRYFIKDNIRFCYYSRGSILESKNWIRKAKNRNLIGQHVYEEWIMDLELIHKKLNSYIKMLKQNLDKNEKVKSNKP